MKQFEDIAAETAEHATEGLEPLNSDTLILKLVVYGFVFMGCLHVLRYVVLHVA